MSGHVFCKCTGRPAVPICPLSTRLDPPGEEIVIEGHSSREGVQLMCAVNGILRTAVVGVREDVDVDVVESVIGCGVVV